MTETRTALRTVRQVLSVVMTPKLLAGLTTPVDEVPGDRPRGPLAAFSWVRSDGSIDTAALAEGRAAVETLLGDRAVLHVDRLGDLPPDTGARKPVSTEVVRLVFERLGAARPVNEAVLNAALAMFVEDVALVRRDAVDDGLLVRSADGGSYRFTG